MKRIRIPILPIAIVAGVIFAVTWAARSSVNRSIPFEVPTEKSVADVVSEVNQKFADDWSEYDLEPSAMADELTVFRRLSLALHGTIPSLEEIRRFESDQKPDRKPDRQPGPPKGIS